MSPKYNSGDYVLIRTWLIKPKPDDVLVINHPQFGRMLKQVKSVTKQALAMTSVNPKGLNTEEIGQITPDQIIGKVIFHIAQ